MVQATPRGQRGHLSTSGGSPLRSPRELMLRTLSAVLFKDLVLRLVFALHLLLFLAYLISFGDPHFRRELFCYRWDLFEVLLVVGILLWSLRSLPNRGEQFFWRYLACGFGFWFLANTASLIPGRQPHSLVGSFVDILVDSLYLAYYLSLVFATEQRPEHSDAAESRSVEEKLNLWGAVLFTFALLVYFVHIPSNLNPDADDRWHLVPLLYVWLDLFFVGRFAYLAMASHSPRWQILYRVLFLAFSGFALADGLDILAILGWAPIPTDYGTSWDIFWIAPFLLIICAARLRHLLPSETVWPTAGKDARGGTASLWLYTIIFPLMHLLLHYIGQDDPASHASRDILVIAYFLVLGAMAVVQHRHRDERRQRAERQLRDSEDNYRQLVESTHNAILVVGSDHILYANSRACQLFDLAQIPIPGSFGSLGLPAPEESDEAGNHASSTEFCRRAGKGQRQDLEMTYRSISYLGQSAWQLMVRDTTALNRLRQQNRRMARLASLGELAADFTDRIRPSLAALACGWRHLSQRLPLELEDQDDIDLAIERIERIVDNVHDFSCVAEPSLHQHDLVQVLSTAIRPLREVFAISGVEIRQDFGHRQAGVQADRHQMLQVFTNVLENASLAMADGGAILIETSNQPGAIEVVITDSGEGIPSDHLERIFDPFYTTRKGGTGLGLAVVARILGRHGCWHAVESEPGKGTRFTLSFPLGQLEAAQLEAGS